MNRPRSKRQAASSQNHGSHGYEDNFSLMPSWTAQHRGRSISRILPALLSPRHLGILGPFNLTKILWVSQPEL